MDLCILHMRYNLNENSWSWYVSILIEGRVFSLGSDVIENRGVAGCLHCYASSSMTILHAN